MPTQFETEFSRSEGGLDFTIRATTNVDIDSDYGADADGNRGTRTIEAFTSIEIIYGADRVTHLVVALNDDFYRQALDEARVRASEQLGVILYEGIL